MGWVQTSSPTASSTGRPCSSQASTAAPSMRHCILPGVWGSSRLPPMKAPAKSVPPEILHHQMFSTPAWAMKSVPHCRTPADSGEPVEPNTRRYDRSPHCAGVMRSEEHTSELQSQSNLVCRLLLEKKNETTRQSETQPHTEPLPLIMRQALII